LTVTPPRASWELRAACRALQPTSFFRPTTGESEGERHVRERVAKQICSQCPVRSECLEYSLTARASFGIWGGLNETERRELSGVAPR